MVPLIGTEDPLIAMDLRGRVPFVSPLIKLSGFL